MKSRGGRRAVPRYFQCAISAQAPRVRNACFSLYAGEVVGFAGLVGSGRTEMAKVAAGVFRRDRSGGGRILLRGKPVVHASPAEAVRDGIVYVTEDRKIDGFFETMTADENIYLGAQARRTLRRFLYSPTRGEALARYSMKSSLSQPRSEAAGLPTIPAGTSRRSYSPRHSPRNRRSYTLMNRRGALMSARSHRSIAPSVNSPTTARRLR